VHQADFSLHKCYFSLHIYSPGKSILRDICREKLIRIHQSAGELHLELWFLYTRSLRHCFGLRYWSHCRHAHSNKGACLNVNTAHSNSVLLKFK